MPLTRAAQVARTAHDKTHLNRVGVPEFGVVEIQVKGQAGSMSKSYRDASSTTPADPSGTGADNFHFAPGPQYAPATWTADPALKDAVKIVYTLHNPQFAIKTAKLEIFRRFTKDPVWERDLEDDELLHGETTLKFNNQEDWDGDIGVNADFPENFLTAEHSPYKVKLTVTGDGVNKSPCAWTYVHVIIGKLELEYGPPEALPLQAPNMEGGIHRDTLTQLLAQGATPPPKDSGPLKVYIQSDIFKTSSNDMFGNELHDRFNTLWDKGPQIPIFCKIKLKSSSDTDVVAPKALGKLKFLWDWESKSTKHATAFTANAENYLVKKTKPKGRNCHLDRGGKRGKTADPIFPANGGYAAAGAWIDGTFPFEVEATPEPREWAAYSYAWRDGIGGSKTGVIFQPSRMAGDAYQITVYVDQVYGRDKKYSLNVDTDAPLKTVPDVIQATTGIFQVWRQVNVRKYVKKNGSVAETINLATVASAYEKAYFELKDRTGGNIVNVAQPDWTTRLNTSVNGSGDAAVRMKAAGDQYAAGGGGIYLRTRDQYRQAYMEEVGTALDGLGLGAKMTDPLRSAIVTAAGANRNNKTGFTGAVAGALATDGGALSVPESAQVTNAASTHWDTVDAFMTDPANKMNTDQNYKALAKTLGKQVVGDCFSPETDAASGCTIFHCDKLHDLGGNLLGYAYDVPNGLGNRCGFVLCATNADHEAGDNIENTATHEFGHHFFLPHTIDAGEKKDYKAHDKSVKTCIMSYNVPTEFCGFCQLRLRGWSKSALSPSSGKNKKT